MSKSNYRQAKKLNNIYLDYAASVSPNTSSIHTLGQKAKEKLKLAREETASILNARPSEIIFTSGATESNNLAIQGLVFAFQEKLEKFMPHIITTNIEHASVLETFKLLKERKLAEVSIVPVEANGIVDPKKIKKEIKKNTILVSVMYANNEIGTIQPIKEIAKEIRHYKKINKRNNIFFHTDVVQAVNYLNINVAELGVDMLSLSGSKIEGAGRVGVFYKKSSVPLVNLFGGGDQEFGFRPGTENLPEILKFVSAFKISQKIKEEEKKRLKNLQDYFFKKLCESFFFLGPRFSGALTPARPFKKETFAEFFVNGDLENRLPNNINITIPDIPSDLLVIELSAKGIMASAKSACKAGDGKASHVIEAIRKITTSFEPVSSPPRKGGEDTEVDGSLRFSMGRGTTKKDIDRTIKALEEILTKLKKWYN